jgi:hypothetical protein
MTKCFYVKGAEETLRGNIDYVGDTLKAAMLKDSYVPNFTSDDFLDDISSHVAATVTLSSKSTTGGKFDAGDPVFSPGSGDDCNAVAVYKDTGNPATSPLLFYTDDIINFPITTTGGAVTPYWNNGSHKIFSLVP